MRTINQTYEIAAPISEVWQAFFDPELINQWGGGPAVMDEKVGTKFTMWDGDIYGTNTKIIKNKLIEQDWVGGKNWEVPSKVVFEFSENGDKTIVKLNQTLVPDRDGDDIEEGWRIYYLGPIKAFFEK